MTAIAARAAVVLAFVMSAWSCARAPVPAGSNSSAAAPTTGDTARGVVSVTGSEPLTAVTLTSAANIVFVVSGPALDDLRTLGGVDVTLFGRFAGTAQDGSTPRPTPVFAAERFSVRTVDGVPAHDGFLIRVAGGISLRLASGAVVALSAPPQRLSDHIGARIYWAGPFDRPPLAYGVIRLSPK